MIRAAAPADAAAVRSLLREAFPGPDEADLVEALERDGDLAIALVAEVSGNVTGYAAFSRMRVEADGQQLAALGLAPVAVAAGHRRTGLAARLIEAGLDQARAQGFAIVFVLGEPAYYGRFGFDAATAAPFQSPYAGPHLMALTLRPLGEVHAGRADYAPAFGALS